MRGGQVLHCLVPPPSHRNSAERQPTEGGQPGLIKGRSCGHNRSATQQQPNPQRTSNCAAKQLLHSLKGRGPDGVWGIGAPGQWLAPSSSLRQETTARSLVGDQPGLSLAAASSQVLMKMKLAVE
ncbi:hypothetical protein Ddc_01932 [Ditylenchus destructor]|nr:hypothetical protein Ddc_01932 [Ditylenchus destructor]